MRKPYWRASCRAFYVLIDGKQVNLGRDREEAFRRYHELMARREPEPEVPSVDVGQVIADFLEWVKRHRAASTYGWYRHFLESFAKAAGSLTVAALTPMHVTRWLDQHGYEGNTGNAAVRAT